jgi:hypothetical protein
MIDLTEERDVDALWQVSLLLNREVQRLITKDLQLTSGILAITGVRDPEQLALWELRTLERRRPRCLHSTRTRHRPIQRLVRHGPAWTNADSGLVGFVETPDEPAVRSAGVSGMCGALMDMTSTH